jgi:hypothetical protein
MENARKVAEAENTSINQLIVCAVAEKLSALQTESLLAMRARKGDKKAFRRVLSKVHSHPTESLDKI